MYDVKNDLVLLENQIPFFVLEKLFHLTVRRLNNNKNWSLTDYVRWCYGNKMSPIRNSNNSGSSSARTWYCSPSDCFLRIFGNKSENPTTKEEGKKEEEEDRNANYFRILHNVHAGYLPLRVQTTHKALISEGVLMPSASELKYAGVMFVPDESGNNLFKFKFSEPKGLLWWCLRARFVIPPLAIYYDTELYLRNLIAFEQFCPAVSKNVTSYACVMDMLVNSDRDVQVLEKAGVMRNCLGATEDATHLFNNLCKEIISEHYFAETCMKATQYRRSFWPKNMIHVRRQYFASPWKFIAFCVGFIVFVMSFVGFVRSFRKKG
ncbi:hypothetical protein RHMOL_Rhmol05G0296700 [Rhododendron molle]|uniref:Uncharacterized protein n=1 Tax=Rhododendron molle TaxID=49168 RepID=A0ACC0NWP7_RHOML|nr:hypothetical protein RHMOL_Rhmol05G0296700 [Rhododendron molle]